jgi:hypothetical protein
MTSCRRGRRIRSGAWGRPRRAKWLSSHSRRGSLEGSIQPKLESCPVRTRFLHEGGSGFCMVQASRMHILGIDVTASITPARIYADQSRSPGKTRFPRESRQRFKLVFAPARLRTRVEHAALETFNAPFKRSPSNLPNRLPRPLRPLGVSVTSARRPSSV